MRDRLQSMRKAMSSRNTFNPPAVEPSEPPIIMRPIASRCAPPLHAEGSSSTSPVVVTAETT